MKIQSATDTAKYCAIGLTLATVPSAVAETNKPFQNQWVKLDIKLWHESNFDCFIYEKLFVQVII